MKISRSVWFEMSSTYTDEDRKSTVMQKGRVPSWRQNFGSFNPFFSRERAEDKKNSKRHKRKCLDRSFYYSKVKIQF